MLHPGNDCNAPREVIDRAGQATRIAQGAAIVEFVGGRHEVTVVGEDVEKFKLRESREYLIMIIEDQEHVFGKFHDSVGPCKEDPVERGCLNHPSVRLGPEDAAEGRGPCEGHEEANVDASGSCTYKAYVAKCNARQFAVYQSVVPRDLRKSKHDVVRAHCFLFPCSHAGNRVSVSAVI